MSSPLANLVRRSLLPVRAQEMLSLGRTAVKASELIGGGLLYRERQRITKQRRW